MNESLAIYRPTLTEYFVDKDANRYVFYTRNQMGMVYIHFEMLYIKKSFDGINATIFTLPVGFRPYARCYTQPIVQMGKGPGQSNDFNISPLLTCMVENDSANPSSLAGNHFYASVVSIAPKKILTNAESKLLIRLKPIWNDYKVCAVVQVFTLLQVIQPKNKLHQAVIMFICSNPSVGECFI